MPTNQSPRIFFVQLGSMQFLPQRAATCLAAMLLAAPVPILAAQSSPDDGAQPAEQWSGRGGSGGGAPPSESGEPEGEQRRMSRDGSRGDRVMPLPPDWPRAGGFGPGSDGRGGPILEGIVVSEMIASGEFGRRELTDEDLARISAVARRVSAEWGSAIAERIQQDPAQARQFLRSGGRRLLALVALESRAPKVFEAKVVELRAQGETARAAAALHAAESGGAPEAEVAGLRAALERAAAAQVEATVATRTEELAAIEARIGTLREELAADRGNGPAIVAELVERARKAATEREQRPRREDGGPAREPRRDRESAEPIPPSQPAKPSQPSSPAGNAPPSSAAAPSAR